jgi:hypothetical protein
MVPADVFEEFDPVPSRHAVVGDDAVELLLGEPFERLAGARRRLDVELVVLAFEVCRRHVREGGLVVDVEDTNGAGPLSGPPPPPLRIHGTPHYFTQYY